MFGVVVVGHLAVQYLGVLRAGVVQELFDLVAADVHQNAAVLLLLPEPRRAARRVQPMRAQADDLQHAADGAVANELSGMDGRLDVQALGVIDGEDCARSRATLRRAASNCSNVVKGGLSAK